MRLSACVCVCARVGARLRPVCVCVRVCRCASRSPQHEARRCQLCDSSGLAGPSTRSPGQNRPHSQTDTPRDKPRGAQPPSKTHKHIAPLTRTRARQQTDTHAGAWSKQSFRINASSGADTRAGRQAGRHHARRLAATLRGRGRDSRSLVPPGVSKLGGSRPQEALDTASRLSRSSAVWLPLLLRFFAPLRLLLLLLSLLLLLPQSVFLPPRVLASVLESPLSRPLSAPWLLTLCWPLLLLLLSLWLPLQLLLPRPWEYVTGRPARKHERELRSSLQLSALMAAVSDQDPKPTNNQSIKHIQKQASKDARKKGASEQAGKQTRKQARRQVSKDASKQASKGGRAQGSKNEKKTQASKTSSKQASKQAGKQVSKQASKQASK